MAFPPSHNCVATLGYVQRIAGPQHQVGQLARCDGAQLVVHAQHLRRHPGQSGQAGFPWQSVGHRIARVLADLARVVRGVAELGEAHFHAGRMQARRILQSRADLVEITRQVGQRIDEHRHLRPRDLRRQFPGLDATGDGDAHVFALRPAQQLADVGGAVDGDHDASVAGQVTRQHRAPGRSQQGMRRIGGDAAARFADQLVEQHPLRRARTAAQAQHVVAQFQEQHARADRIGAAIQADHAALPGDEGTAGIRAQQGEAQAFDARDRDQHRLRVVGQGHIELRPHRLVVGQVHRAVHGLCFAGYFLDADLGDAAEQGRSQRLAVGFDHADRSGRLQVHAHRADDAALDQHVRILQRALRAGGVHGGVADQHVLGGAARCRRTSARKTARTLFPVIPAKAGIQRR